MDTHWSHIAPNPTGPNFSHTTRIRPGKYLHTSPALPWWEQEKTAHMAKLLDMADTCPSTVAVLQSAVLLHGGSLLHPDAQAHVATGWYGAAAPRSGMRLRHLSKAEHRQVLASRKVVHHRYSLGEGDLALVNGIVTTTIRATVRDVARFLSSDNALCAVDSLVARAIDRPEDWRADRTAVTDAARAFLAPIIEELRQYPGQRGVRQARAVLEHASALSESVYETEARRLALAHGHTQIEAQMEVRTAGGTKWADLGIRRSRTILEINGDVKYEGEEGERRRHAESIRRESLREADYTVIDLTPQDVLERDPVLHSLDLHAGHLRSKQVLPLLTRRERNGLRRP